MLKKLLRIFLWTIGTLLVLLIAIVVYVKIVSSVEIPEYNLIAFAQNKEIEKIESEFASDKDGN